MDLFKDLLVLNIIKIQYAELFQKWIFSIEGLSVFQNSL